MLRLGTNTPLAFRTVFWRTAMVSDTLIQEVVGHRLAFDRIFRINKIGGEGGGGNHAKSTEGEKLRLVARLR